MKKLKIISRNSFDVISDLKSIIQLNKSLFSEEQIIKIDEIIEEGDILKKIDDREKKIQLVFEKVMYGFVVIGLTVLAFNFNSMKKDVTNTFNEVFDDGKSLYDTTYTIKSDTVITYEKYTVNDYLKSQKKLDSLISVEHEYELENRDYTIKVLRERLDYVARAYSIKFIEKNDSVRFVSERVDSALRLFPYYKDKLVYDKSNNRWVITVVK